MTPKQFFAQLSVFACIMVASGYGYWTAEKDSAAQARLGQELATQANTVAANQRNAADAFVKGCVETRERAQSQADSEETLADNDEVIAEELKRQGFNQIASTMQLSVETHRQIEQTIRGEMTTHCGFSFKPVPPVHPQKAAGAK